MIKNLRLVLLALLLAQPAFALQPFTVDDIKVEGNNRIDDGTVFNYLPVQVGDEIDDDLVRESIKTLFETGFFRNVKFRQDGNVLVVEVEERPSISEVRINGNKDIDTETLTGVLDRAELTRGRILNQRRLNEVIQAMTEAYFARGRYSARIESEITRLDENRARIDLNISEGRVAHIKKINLVGNKQVSDKEIKAYMKLTDKRGWNPLSRRDLYSKQKLEGDIESVREFYTDNGFFDFDITSSNVTISPNKQDIFISLVIREGDVFQLGKLSISGASPIIDEAKAAELTTLKKKRNVFSRKIVGDVRKAINDELSNNGFALADVNPVPSVDRDNKIVDIDFVAAPRERIYVRRIEIVGNTVTQDEVIRRELRQFESGWFSAKSIKRSQERLRRLGHFEDIKIDTERVPGVVDQVDLRVSVKERNTGNLTFGLGYSDAEGALFQVGYSQRNFLGTGRQVDVTVDNSDVTDTYEFRYTNPYYTEDGISRSLWLKSRKLDASESTTAEYVADTIEFGVDYTIPVSESNSVNLTAFAENIQLSETEETPPELTSFIEAHPENNNIGARVSFSKDTLNDFIFPTKGALGSISLEASLPSSDLEYYKLNIRGSNYLPLGINGVSFKSTIKLGYGNGYGDSADIGLPFYKNYYAGGPTTVRGYNSRSLGPRDTGDTPEALGGDRRAIVNLELLTAPFGGGGSKDKRIGLFADAGMVFGSGETFDIGAMRYSAGIVMQWYSPVGPLTLSYGVPLNEEEGDDLEKIQISLGTLFR